MQGSTCYNGAWGTFGKERELMWADSTKCFYGEDQGRQRDLDEGGTVFLNEARVWELGTEMVMLPCVV